MNDSPRKNPVTLEDLLRVKRAERPPELFWAEFERGLRVKQAAARVESSESLNAADIPGLSWENSVPRKTAVALEDLLRLKRAERPPAEFWAKFEQGMRAKQLAAIVEPRPWWAPFIRFSAKVSRYQLPVGAAAILAVTFLSLREYRTVTIKPIYEPAVAAVSAEAPATVDSVRDDPIATRVMPAASSPQVVADDAPALVAVSADVSADQDQPAVRNNATSVGAASHVAPAPVELNRSARTASVSNGFGQSSLAVMPMAENWTVAQEDSPGLRQIFGGSMRSSENLPKPQEPLARISMAGSSSRIFGSYNWKASTNSNSDSDSALRDDQSALRLNGHNLNESDIISRVGVVGDRVTVKF